jgi:hypothetical protein
MSPTLTSNDSETRLLKPILYDRTASVPGRVIRSGLPCELEPRQWRQTTKGASSIFAVCQLLQAVFFLAVALVQIAICFAELSRLLERHCD